MDFQFKRPLVLVFEQLQVELLDLVVLFEVVADPRRCSVLLSHVERVICFYSICPAVWQFSKMFNLLRQISRQQNLLLLTFLDQLLLVLYLHFLLLSLRYLVFIFCFLHVDLVPFS